MNSKEIKNGVRDLLNLIIKAIYAQHEEGWTQQFIDQLKDARLVLTSLDNDFSD